MSSQYTNEPDPSPSLCFSFLSGLIGAEVFREVIAAVHLTPSTLAVCWCDEPLVMISPWWIIPLIYSSYYYYVLAGVPVGGKLSVCLIWNCMKYRIIILIIIIKRLGEILLSYMATHHTRTHPVSMYFPSQHFMILLVDDVVSSRRPITPEIHLLSLTIFYSGSVSYPNLYELKC